MNRRVLRNFLLIAALALVELGTNTSVAYGAENACSRTCGNLYKICIAQAPESACNESECYTNWSNCIIDCATWSNPCTYQETHTIDGFPHLHCVS